MNVLAVGLKGVIIDTKAWDIAHEKWFEEYAHKLQDPTILDWVGRDDYFTGVDKVIKRIMPNASEQEQRKRARDEYHAKVIEWVQEHHGVRTEIVNILASVDARVVVVTSAETKGAHELLNLIPQGIIDAVYASDEKDDKKAVFEQMLEHEEKPVLYIGSGRQETRELCAIHSIAAVDITYMSAKELENAIIQALE